MNPLFTSVWMTFAKILQWPAVLGIYVAFFENESIFLWPFVKDLHFDEEPIGLVLRAWDGLIFVLLFSSNPLIMLKIQNITRLIFELLCVSANTHFYQFYASNLNNFQPFV